MENNAIKNKFEKVTDKFDEEADEDFIVLLKIMIGNTQYRLVKILSGENNGRYCIRALEECTEHIKNNNKEFIANRIKQDIDNSRDIFEKFMSQALRDTELPKELKKETIKVLSTALQNGTRLGI